MGTGGLLPVFPASAVFLIQLAPSHCSVPGSRLPSSPCLHNLFSLFFVADLEGSISTAGKIESVTAVELNPLLRALLLPLQPFLEGGGKPEPTHAPLFGVHAAPTCFLLPW